MSRHTVAFAVISLLGWQHSQVAMAETRLVTEAAAAHDLAPDLGRDAHVHLVGTITYYDPGERAAFLQDQTGGIFVNLDKPYPMQQGDLVELDGRTESSYRTEVALDPAIRVLGPGNNFAAPISSYRVLASGVKDCRMVSIKGRVRDVDIGHYPDAPSGHMDVIIPGGEVEVYISAPAGLQLNSLLDAEVEVTGVAGGSFDATWQMTGIILYVQNASAVRILQTPATNAAKLPLTSMDDLLKTRYVLDTSQRVRVQGTVTYYKTGYAAVLESQGKSIYVETRQTADLKIGDVAEAFGFASERGYALSLREASILKTGRRADILPRHLGYAEALSGLYSDNLISLTGDVISELHDSGSDTVVMNVDGHPVSAYLEGARHLIDFAPGSRVRMTGICRIIPGNPYQAPYVFHLDLRDASDVVMLAKPSWWTIRHLTTVLSVFALSSFASAICIMILRRRILRQSGRIQRSMAIASERTRILELISSNQSLDVVLSEMCKSARTLLPGADCSYFLFSNKRDASDARATARATITAAKRVFELPLIGSAQEVLGSLEVSPGDNPLFSSSDQEEVCFILKELATLALGQSLLYQGLLHHSTHDPLTELANRRLCDTKLTCALEEAAQQGSKLAVIYIDINRFKQVNDNCGHKVGDNYLKLISARLLSQIRVGDTLARVGGDEFMVIAPLGAHVDSISIITARLKACFDEPFYTDGETIDGSASFGVAVYPEHGLTAEALKRKADHAMYLAKRSTRGTVEASTDISIFNAEELAEALLTQRFRLAYQPQFSAQGKVTGLEALLRLEDPVLGILTPDAFISTAEQSDIIVEIGTWVLRQALQDAVRWQLHTSEGIRVAVNVSIRQLIQPDFADSVLACLKEQAFPASHLEIELVERSLLAGNPEILIQLERLHRAGVRISLDDFGTGQSSLSILHKLPIDTIKLDRSFILAMDEEPKVLPVIQAIAYMATSLGKRIVAEGIEHVGSVPTLLRMAEMDFQGYLLSRPILAHEVDNVIGTWRSGIDLPVAFRTTLRQLATSSGALL